MLFPLTLSDKFRKQTFKLHHGLWFLPRQSTWWVESICCLKSSRKQEKYFVILWQSRQQQQLIAPGEHKEQQEGWFKRTKFYLCEKSNTNGRCKSSWNTKCTEITTKHKTKLKTCTENVTIRTNTKIAQVSRKNSQMQTVVHDKNTLQVF